MNLQSVENPTGSSMRCGGHGAVGAEGHWLHGRDKPRKVVWDHFAENMEGLAKKFGASTIPYYIKITHV